MSAELRDELQEIDGIGEKTADKILDVLANHKTVTDLDEAIELLEADRPAHALDYLRQLA